MDHFRYETWAVTAFRIFAYVTLLGPGRCGFLVVPLWGRVSEERVALYVEEHEPSLQAAVLSAVEVGAREGRGPATSPAPWSSGSSKTRSGSARPSTTAGTWSGRGCAAPPACSRPPPRSGMAVTILSPAFMRHAAPFLFAPWNVRAASPYAIEVDPGNATVAARRQPARDRAPEGLRLGDGGARRCAPGPAGDWKRWPMTAEPGRGRVPLRALRPRRRPPTTSWRRRACARAPFRLDVADIPYVKRIDLEYRFPAYTGLAPQTVEDTGDVAALQRHGGASSTSPRP